MELASDVASHLLEAEPRQHSTYVLLSSMNSGLGMWSDRAIVQKEMKNKGLSKVPGWSWIEVKNKVFAFVAGSVPPSMPGAEEIFRVLDDLYSEMDDERHTMEHDHHIVSV